MLRLLSVLVIGLLLGACSTVERMNSAQEEADIIEPDFAQAWVRAERQNQSKSAQDYFERWSPDAMWATDRPTRVPEWLWMQWPFTKAVNECVTAIFPAVDSARMVFRIDSFGSTVRAVTDQTGFIEECVTRKTRGLRVPVPPASGFLLCHRYTRLSGSQYRLDGCGPKHWQSVCTLTGTSTSCKSKFTG